MRRLRLLTLFLLLSLLPWTYPAGAAPAPQATAAPNLLISAPAGGQALQGQVEITGNSAVAGFQSASLSFTYHGDLTSTWFIILETGSPVAYGTLGVWDTTTITDGDYDVRLSVLLSDGSLIATTVEGLRVRNYSPVETSTSTPPAATATAQPTTPGAVEATLEVYTPSPSPSVTATPSQTPVPPTITPLPTNPAELSKAAMLNTLGKGGLLSLGLFALLGIYLLGRAIVRRPPKPKA
jgi:hypothetical protein